ncbi:Methyltransferase domain-containing protein [Luteibacter sp. UNC138MFCol5.1]|uniref:class I SAM-dependent methyltransferase n=1 Tax=Luteibacter sp. UNC138MFCol5.1 TaxID=1502774 RepID=UPI0008D45D36|nr:class I SAM-dependent methyltransferase [Luteibacter sp. UNC138MFCol5.1]SEO84622.1 Methyltransferase domain-containing protein [Luteibacter sp. UNC138MFCol5.1]
MREVELAPAIRLLSSATDVLELGAGDGWQSRALADLGFRMTAVDVDASRIGPNPAYPVTLYDGLSLPFPDQSFDAIYSSNVLEHVEAFDRVQQELARVLRPGGFAVHCVPSGVWRTWTTLGHPIYALKALLSLRHVGTPGRAALRENLGKSRSRARKAASLVRLAFLSPRHGEHGTLLSEHGLFRRAGWHRRFVDSGWSVRSVVSTGVFYSGNEVFGLRLGESRRRVLARIVGSSSLIFTLVPRTR